MIELGLFFIAIFLVFGLTGMVKESEDDKEHLDNGRKRSLTKHLQEQNRKKNRFYIEHIAKQFERKGYLVYVRHNGDFNAKGIDLIANKFDETCLIKCDSSSEKSPYVLDKKHLKVFMINCDYFLKANPGYLTPVVKKILITSESILDRNAEKFLDDYGPKIEHLQIPYIAPR